MTKEIDPALLRRLLRYDAETGKLFWLARGDWCRGSAADHRRFNTQWAGKEAFTSTCGNGYKQGSIFCSKHLAHRVIWALVHGYWPIEIDHLKGSRADNRLSKMRDVTRAVNTLNAGLRSDNKTGVTGIRWTKGAWQAQITIGGQRHYLGRFQSLEAAKTVRLKAQAEMGFHPNHGRAA